MWKPVLLNISLKGRKLFWMLLSMSGDNYLVYTYLEVGGPQLLDIN